jgi:aminoglycoside 6'-N-acetyltransferase I
MAAAEPHPVVTRSATAEDAARLVALFAQLGYDIAAESVATRLAALASDGQSHCLVATDGASIVGVVTLYVVPVVHRTGGWCRITALIVDEQARGRGVGQTLMAAAEEVAVAAGCLRIEATSAVQRDDAHRFYDRLGYVRPALHFLKALDGQVAR